MLISQSGDFQMFLTFIPKIGEDSHFDQHMFQLGWWNKTPTSFPGCILDPAYPGGSCIFINPITFL